MITPLRVVGEGSPAVSADDRIVAALDRGDLDGAFRMLMSSHGDLIYSYCLRMVRDPAAAEDTLQQVFEQAYEGLPRYRREAPLTSWLLGIAHHRCLDSLRSTRRRERRVEPTDRLPDSHADDGDPGESLDLARAVQALERCVGSLAPAVRSALLLHFHNGLSFERLGVMLRAKAGTLQARVARALPLLRRCLVAQGIRP